MPVIVPPALLPAESLMVFDDIHARVESEAMAKNTPKVDVLNDRP
jgi:hypothetical protein